MQAIEFAVHTPLSGPVLRSHAYHALSLGLPEATPLRGPLKIIANGPSAMSADTSGETLAVNGALKLFARGVGPTYWAACDPQEIVASFIPDNPPTNTIYLVASHCHPKVFEKLKGRDVRLWHVDNPDTRDLTVDGVPTAVSITLVVMQLMGRMGYRRFETWGWDGCYLDGRDHAVGQAHSGDNITIRVGDHDTFDTTSTWAAEAQDAVMLLSMADFRVKINGLGMFKAICDVKLKGR